MLFNKTSGKQVMKKVRFAETHWQKMKGLMFEDSGKFDYALVFTLPRESIAEATIHMLFVFFPIDVIYLDKNKRVVDIARNIKPFSLGYKPKKPSLFFVEVPATKSKGISLGDQLDWKA